VALEIWVDVECTPVRIRLEGVLNAATAHSLALVVEDLIVKGLHDFAVNAAALRAYDSDVARAAMSLSALARSSGARLTWDMSAIASPTSVPTDDAGGRHAQFPSTAVGARRAG
jgi:hypothetical protein